MNNIYDLNKISYIISKGVDVDIYQEINGDRKRVFIIANDEINKILNEYSVDAKIHSFLTGIGILRKRMRELGDLDD